jgi:hypothetical protein
MFTTASHTLDARAARESEHTTILTGLRRKVREACERIPSPTRRRAALLTLTHELTRAWPASMADGAWRLQNAIDLHLMGRMTVGELLREVR